MFAPATLLATASSCIVVAISDVLNCEFIKSILRTRLTMDGTSRLPECINFLLLEGIKCRPEYGLEKVRPKEAISVLQWV